MSSKTLVGLPHDAAAVVEADALDGGHEVIREEASSLAGLDEADRPAGRLVTGMDQVAPVAVGEAGAVRVIANVTANAETWKRAEWPC